MASFDLDKLPRAARRWLSRALKPEREPAARVRLQQHGTLSIRNQWTPFKAQARYDAEPLSFAWKATLHIGAGLWVAAKDGHKEGRGWGGARLWGVLPMGMRKGPEVLKSQLMRNLGELPLVPCLAVHAKELEWIDHGPNQFSVRATVADQTATVHYEADSSGDIAFVSAPDRPLEAGRGFEEHPWRMSFFEWDSVEGMRVPLTSTGTFVKEDGPWKYWQAHLTGYRLN